MMAGPGPQRFVWKLWSALVCVQLLLMVGSAHAGRMLQQQQRRLTAFCDRTASDGTVIPRHAPAVQSFQVSDGSWVDCIPIEGQISAHHPALKDHIIQMESSFPSRPSGQARRSSKDHPQLFAREYGGCPEGSIPVQRVDPNRPHPKKSHHSPILYRAATAAKDKKTHEYAVTGLPPFLGFYSGASHIFSVNSPDLGNASTDYSLSQLWIVDGSFNDKTLSTIEVGWQKFPSAKFETGGQLDGPHLFVYWTADAYNGTGCYDLLCPGFVQTSNSWVIGGPMRNYTSLEQKLPYEFELELKVLYSSTSQNWILYLEGEQVGYWPSSIYLTGTNTEEPRLQGTASEVQWGGEAAFYQDLANHTVHSKTTMGSGAYPSAGFPVAAYYRNISYRDEFGNIYDVSPSDLVKQRFFNNPFCYNVTIGEGGFADWGLTSFMVALEEPILSVEGARSIGSLLRDDWSSCVFVWGCSLPNSTISVAWN